MGLLLLWFGVTSWAKHYPHQCQPGSEAFVCMIFSFKYNPQESIPQFHLPKDVKAIRINEMFYYMHDPASCISTYDALLHRQLNSPIAITITHNCLKSIEIPPNIEYADFERNPIENIYAPSNQSTALRYLSFNRNTAPKVSRFENVSKFVNLESLYMTQCNIDQIPAGLFDNLLRLKRLGLNGNRIRVLDFSLLPPSLTVLLLEDNNVDQLTFARGHLPALKLLQVESNLIKDVDMNALLERVPNLKLFAIAHNPIRRKKLIPILDELVRRNIAYYNFELPEDGECEDDERKFRGACIPYSSFPLEAGDWVEIVFLVLLLIVVLCGVVFGGVKLWTKYQPAFKISNNTNQTPS